MARTRAEDFQTKRRAILAAAAAVMAEQGPERASMARIAERAEVSKALLYHYFPGRDALVFAIVHDHLSDLDAALAQADDPARPPAERLRALVHAVLAAYRHADDAHKVQLTGAPTLPDDERAQILAVERRIVRRFAEVLRLAAPDLPQDRLMPATMSLFGMMNWVYMWFRDGGALSRAAYADLATDLVLGGLPALARPRPQG
jgi:AcrR family transcriptional regulator